MPPSMMLSLLIYNCAVGRMSSRQIEKATYEDVASRYICDGVPAVSVARDVQGGAGMVAGHVGLQFSPRLKTSFDVMTAFRIQFFAQRYRPSAGFPKLAAWSAQSL